MKKFIVPFLALMAVLFSTGLAQAQSSRLYFAGYLGLNTNTGDRFSESTSGISGEVDFRNAVSLAGAIGLRLTPQWHLEAEISRRNADINDVSYSTGNLALGGDATTWLYLLNVIYDVDWNWRNFQPFVTAGAGLAYHDVSVVDGTATVPNATDQSLGFAYTVGGGLKYRLKDNAAITGNYRYVGTSDMEIDSFDLGYSTHEIRLGLEYDLPTDWILGK